MEFHLDDDFANQLGQEKTNSRLYSNYKSQLPRGLNKFIIGKLIGSISILLCILLLGFGIILFIDVPEQYNVKLISGFVNLTAAIILSIRIIGSWIVLKNYAIIVTELEDTLYMAGADCDFSLIKDHKLTMESKILRENYESLKARVARLQEDILKFTEMKNNLVADVAGLQNQSRL